MPVGLALLIASLAVARPGPWRLDSPADDDEFQDIVHAADARSILAVVRRGVVLRWPLDTGEPADRGTTVGVAGDQPLRLSPGGRYVAPESAKGGVFDLTTGKRTAGPPPPAADIDRVVPTFAADGRHLAFGMVRQHGSPVPGPTRVVTWDAVAGKPVGTVELPVPPGGMVSQFVVLSADGRLLLSGVAPHPSGTGDGTELAVWETATGRRRATLTPHAGGFVVPIFVSADGGTVLFDGPYGAHVWRPGEAHARAVERTKIVAPIAVRPDGRSFLAWVTDPRKVKDFRPAIYETATLAVRAELPWHELGQVQAAAYSPDGHEVVLATRRHLWRYRTPPRRTDRPLPALWDALTGSALGSGPAIRELIDRPTEAVPFLRTKLTPAARTTALDVPATIAQLDAPAFAVREAATAKLAAASRFALPQLRAELGTTKSTERRLRLERLIAIAGEYSTDDLRHIRAVEVLEAVATPAAREVLAPLAAGAPDAVLTREAVAAVARLVK